jgi:DNA-binding beta-propeller fold protein YncE
MRTSLAAAICLAASTMLADARSQETSETAPSQSVKAETVVGGLNSPCGVAIQPETGTLFVSDSGEGRICRIVEGKLEPVIAGSRRNALALSAKHQVGPLGLLFLDRERLVVGDGGYGEGQDCVRVFKLPAASAEPLNYEDSGLLKLGPLAAEGDFKATGSFFGLAANKAGLYVTSTGKDHSSILKAEIRGTKLGDLTRIDPSPTPSVSQHPTPIVVSMRGELVVAETGRPDASDESVLKFYSARTDEPLLSLKTGLHSVTALGYSPKSGLLYATNFASSRSGDGGVYRLDSDSSTGELKIKPTRIASLAKPSALAFDKDGNAYVTLFGDESEEAPHGGSVVKVSGL